MRSRKLRDLEVSAIGYGCMGLSGGYGATPTKEEAVKIIRAAHDMSCTLFNTAEFYVMDTVNEELVGEAYKRYTRQSNYFHKVFDYPQKPEDNSKAHLMQKLRTHLENSLKKLRNDHVEIYTLARVNKDILLEDVVIVWESLSGKAKYLAGDCPSHFI